MEEIVKSPAEVLAEYSPLALAFLGDAAYELEIRKRVVLQGNSSPKSLNERSSYLAMARTQAKIVDALKFQLTEEEADIVRRGRNANPNTIPKNASPTDYLKATGFETLIGYLFLTGRKERMKELIRLALDSLER